MAKAKKVATVSTYILTSEVAGKFSDIPKKQVKEVVDAFLDAITNHVGKDVKVRIGKLGIMQLKERASRIGRNPQTGEAMKIPASKKVFFRVSTSLKEKVGVKKSLSSKKMTK